jgi:tetratricopeptide (TPR) repeat protein
MTEREKLRTLGGYYFQIVRDYNQAIGIYKELVARYPADFAGHNNLALAYFYVLDFPGALEEGQRAIEIYPRSFKFRANYALYAMYASDFEKAAATARRLLEESNRDIQRWMSPAFSATIGSTRDARWAGT